LKRSFGWPVLIVAALAWSGCQGGGAQNPLVPGSGLGPAAQVLGNGPSGATLLRVHVPWAAGSATPPGGAVPGGATAAPFAPSAAANPSLPASATGGTAAQVQTLTVSVAGPTSLTQTIAVAPGSPGCANVSAGAVCQAALGLLPGNYTATVAAYASANPSPVNAVGGAQTIAFAVAYGAANVVNLALSGIPTQVDVVPGSSMSAENAQDGIDLYGAGKHPLVAMVLDANSNIILGPSAPSVTVAQTGGGLALSISNNYTNGASSAPNVFAVSPPLAYAGGTATLHVTANFSAQTANPCVQAGASCNGNVTVDVRQLLAVANSSINTVTLYAGAQSAPLVTIAGGVTNPQALVFDAAGDLFVASQPGTVTEYSVPYTGTPSTIALGVNHPQAMALDSRGNLFVANGSASNTVTEYAPPYSGAPIATISAGINDPVSLGLDSGGNLFVSNQAADTVTVYAPPYGSGYVTLSNGLNGPNSLAIDGRGNVFVSNLNSTPNSVVEFVPPFSSASVPAVTVANGVNEQGAIGLSNAANLFVPNQGANTVTEYAPPYAGAPTTISGGQSQPVALAIDVSGNLFVANYGNNTVTEYAPPYAGASWITFSNGVNSPQALALSPPTTSLVP
jgi:hypothetical protein